MMVSFGEKVKIKKAGNLNEGRSYVITTVCIYVGNCSVIVFMFSRCFESRL